MPDFDFSGWILLAGIGCISGLSAGLMGIGGGLIVVPSLIYGLPHLGLNGPETAKIAAATSLALVIPTSLSSARAHAKRGAVNKRFCLVLTPPIVAGSAIAPFIAQHITASTVVIVFMAYALFFAWGLLQLPEPQTATSPRPAVRISNSAAIGLKCLLGGCIAGLLGMGCGFFTVPILSRLTSMKTAIGTSSALGLPLAIAGTAGYLMSPSPDMCRGACAGDIFLPAVIAIGATAILAAPAGAALANQLPVRRLKQVFAAMLVATVIDLTIKSFPDLLSTTKLSTRVAQINGAVCAGGLKPWPYPNNDFLSQKK